VKLFAVSYLTPDRGEPEDCCAVAAASRDRALLLAGSDPRIDQRWGLIAKPVNANVLGPERVLSYRGKLRPDLGAAL
jgi:hypothetical protein